MRASEGILGFQWAYCVATGEKQWTEPFGLDKMC